MASAQVLPNSAGSSRKKEHLEAGKRRLEEFRKKKAAAKKAALASQSHIPDSTAHEKQASEHRQSHINPDGATADGRSNEANTSGLISDNDKSHGFASDVDYKSVPSGYVNLQSHHVSSDFQQIEPKQEENNIPGMTPETSSDYSRQTDDQASNVGSTGEVRYSDAFAFSRSSASADGTANSHRPDIYGAAESLSSIGISSSDRFQNMNSTINDVAASVYAEAHATNLLRDQSDSVHPIVNIPAFSSEPGHGQLEELEKKDNSTSVLKERNNTNASGGLSSFYSHCSSISADFNSDVSSSNNGPSFSVLAQTHPRKSRTSFIDSLNISRNAPAADKSYSDKETSTASKFQGSNFFASSAMQNSLATSAPVEQLPKSASPPSDNYFGSTSREQKLFDGLNYKLESSSQKQNEDFAALEQHIEDLTREKFSLQRALETSKSLAESLAAENSSLTESYNQQASSVTQLKAEIERLRAEIKARLVELEAIKVEYRSAQLECNAADERAKLLASEVIGLEEKALRLRSNELKLEQELENSNAEIASIKKKLSSLERERQDLLQTIDVLKEEKKLMQSKLQKASASEISGGIKQEHAKKEASTCTDDLGHDFDEAHRDSSILNNSNLPGEDDADNLLMLATHRSLGVEDSPTTIPPDQVQMIQNISSLICEIMAEKEELVQALLTERSTCTKLKDLNKELSQKLEAQTQRLELLTAHTMASENITAKQPTAPLITTGERETIAYADEGDEVVERVLGWIMKLFPGGPTKRKTTRL